MSNPQKYDLAFDCFLHPVFGFTTLKPSDCCLQLSFLLIDLDLDLVLIAPSRQPLNPNLTPAVRRSFLICVCLGETRTLTTPAHENARWCSRYPRGPKQRLKTAFMGSIQPLASFVLKSRCSSQIWLNFCSNLDTYEPSVHVPRILLIYTSYLSTAASFIWQRWREMGGFTIHILMSEFRLSVTRKEKRGVWWQLGKMNCFNNNYKLQKIKYWWCKKCHIFNYQYGDWSSKCI